MRYHVLGGIQLLDLSSSPLLHLHHGGQRGKYHGEQGLFSMQGEMG